jgi:UDP-glucuronate 4-epimerase
MKTVLVTGGAGFIGSNLVGKLLQEGYRVACVDNFDTTYDPSFKEENIAPFLHDKNFSLYRVDIRNLDELRTVFEKEKPTHVAHLAAKADTRAAVENPRVYVSVNMDGTLNMLELCREFGVQMTVLASSGSVYGNNPNVPWKEDERTDFPLSAYGVTKKAMELLAYTYHHNFNMHIICLRYFNVYGENNRPTMVPYMWAKAFLTGEEIEMSGEGTRRRDFTYVGDVADATMLALESSLGYEVINVADSKPHSLTDLFAVFEKVTGVAPPVRKRSSHPASVNEMYADSSKAKKLLGWEPKVFLEEGVTRLVAWFKANRLT